MTIDEAIKILKLPLFYPNTPKEEGFANAIKLGIEALKQVKRTRDKRFPVQVEELLGEIK